jgi:hypothetical protein
VEIVIKHDWEITWSFPSPFSIPNHPKLEQPGIETGFGDPPFQEFPPHVYWDNGPTSAKIDINSRFFIAMLDSQPV